ncbi:hypothetical protein THIOM_000198 [Candidatus Thiomargarita nelsonii]|uniref:Uncharacterized protein n=1 Tax=Candidatus Thiomargarita nelsonii TaxID=1003181 RepID=A0A176S7A1_9GAMM|nr:hypothetical protein THIOM_000198 [Candidatus Thiomargarita nelsonii]
MWRLTQEVPPRLYQGNRPPMGKLIAQPSTSTMKVLRAIKRIMIFTACNEFSILLFDLNYEPTIRTFLKSDQFSFVTDPLLLFIFKTVVWFPVFPIYQSQDNNWLKYIRPSFGHLV